MIESVEILNDLIIADMIPADIKNSILDISLKYELKAGDELGVITPLYTLINLKTFKDEKIRFI
jgi:hypothetical protein